MKAKQIIERLVMGCVLALSLTTNLRAESYWSAKDPDLPPLPFNRHPELPVVEIEKDKFLVDDTSIPDTPEQATSRKLRQEAAERAKAIASNPASAKAIQEAQQAAQAASFAIIIDEISPWLHESIKMPDGTPAESFQSLMDTQALDFSATADSVIAQQQAARDEAIAWGETNGWPAVIGGSETSGAYLVGREGDMPDYLAPHDLAAAVTISTTNIWPGGPTGFNLTGTNRAISMWDEGSPRLTHQEFGSRVSELDGVTALSHHSTAVAGMLAAAGLNLTGLGPAAKGMAYEAQVQARDFDLDLGEMTGALGTNQMRLSNQSYGTIAGWYFDTASATWYWFGNPEISGTEDPRFGNYTTNSSNYDTLVQNAPTYLQVWSAGNDQGEAPPVQPTNHVERTGITNTFRPADGDAGGFDTLAQQASAKNVLTVGATYALPNGYTSSTNLLLAPFSSCGPTDDGRIKPDVVADGVTNLVPIAGSDNNYFYWQGTSFSAPSVCGSVGLLSQFQKQLLPNAGDLLASTLKGLVIHTADSGTTNAGPSYRFGWGLMNTRTAATLVKSNATHGLKNYIKEVRLTNSSVIQFPVLALGGTNPLKVTICWTDPAGVPNSVTNLDNPSAKLINDLDLRVIAPTGTTNLPWLLNPDLTNKTSTARSAVATTGDDNRNNVEQVRIAQPTNGTYLVQVAHKGNLQSNSTQWVSILLSGLSPQEPPPLVINQIVQTATNQIAIGWPAVVGQLYQVQSLDSIGMTNWANVDGIISARLTNVMVQIPMSATNDQQFYRVVQLP